MCCIILTTKHIHTAQIKSPGVTIKGNTKTSQHPQLILRSVFCLMTRYLLNEFRVPHPQLSLVFTAN